MKLTKEQYSVFKMYIHDGLKQTGKSFDDIRNWLNEIGDEKLSHFNCLTAVKLAKVTDEGYDFVSFFNLNDNHWCTIGRKYFKEFQ